MWENFSFNQVRGVDVLSKRFVLIFAWSRYTTRVRASTMLQLDGGEPSWDSDPDTGRVYGGAVPTIQSQNTIAHHHGRRRETNSCLQGERRGRGSAGEAVGC